MIIPKLYGRLGNQCFQIAAAIAHAKKLETAYRVPAQTINPRIWPIYFTNLEKPYRSFSVTEYYYKELRHCYDPLPEVDELTIDGYFQSEKYFADAKPQIQMALNFFAQPDDFVAVHVRRGDYLQYPDQFPVLPVGYYIEAIQDAIIGWGYSKYKIYSDDIAWCKNEFNHKFFTGLNIEFDNSPNPLWAMRDMYNAAAFIISNSTFSLFPATLRPDNPLVIAPAEHRWYGPANKHLETFDLMPERFIKI